MKKLRFTALLLALVMLLGILPAGAAAPSRAPAPAPGTEEEWAALSPFLGRYNPTWDTMPEKSESNVLPETALMGNGDMGAVSAGTDNRKGFGLTKMNFWSCGSMTDYAHVNTASGTRVTQLSVGTLMLGEQNPGQESGTFREVQNLADGTLHTSLHMSGKPVEICSWLSATENLLVMEVRSDAAEALELEAVLAARRDVPQYPWNAEALGNTILIEKSSANMAPENPMSWTSKVCVSTFLVGAEATAQVEDDHTASLHFTLNPNETVYVVTAVGGGGQNYDHTGKLLTAEPRDEARALGEQYTTQKALSRLKEENDGWWKEYWLRSYLDIGDETLHRYYYRSMYYMGCAAHADSPVPAGIAGPWTTTDGTMWSGDYHLNYNFIAPFFGMQHANRGDAAVTLRDPMLQFMPQGRQRALTDLKKIYPAYINGGAQPGDNGTDYNGGRFPGRPDLAGGIEDAVLYPVAIGPWGSIVWGEGGGYLMQTYDAAFSAQGLTACYRYTLDGEYLRSIYPLLLSIANFYEKWCEKEVYPDGSYRYIVWTGAHETTFDLNSGSAIGAIRNILECLLLGAERGDIEPPAGKLALWEDMYTHFAEIPIRERSLNGSPVRYVSLSEVGVDIWPGSAHVALEFASPSDLLAFDSDPALMEASRNAILIKAELNPQIWWQINDTCKVYLMAIRAGMEPRFVIDKFKEVLRTSSKENGTIYDGVHGIEKAGATEFMHLMLLQSDRGTIKVFPNWTGEDASFTRLREKGAFLVSSRMTGGQVEFVDVTSEKGGTLKLVIPWETAGKGAKLTDLTDNKEVAWTMGVTENSREPYLTAETLEGHSYRLEKAPSDPTVQAQPPVDFRLTGLDEAGKATFAWNRNPMETGHVTYTLSWEGGKVTTEETTAEVTGLIPGTAAEFRLEAALEGEAAPVPAAHTVAFQVPTGQEEGPVLLYAEALPAVAGVKAGTEKAQVSALLPSAAWIVTYRPGRSVSRTRAAVLWDLTDYDVNSPEDQQIPGTAVSRQALLGEDTVRAAVSVLRSAPESGAQWLKLSQTEITVEPKGPAGQLYAAVEPAGVLLTDGIWASGNNRIAQVSPSGKIMGIRPGTTTVTVTAPDGSCRAACVVYVHEASQGYRIEDTDKAITTHMPDGSKWSVYNKVTYGAAYRDEKGLKFSVKFNGTNLHLYGNTAPNGPVMDVTVDGQPQGKADFYAPKGQDAMLLWSGEGFEPGAHVAEFTFNGELNPAVTGYSAFQAAIDYLLVRTDETEPETQGDLSLAAAQAARSGVLILDVDASQVDEDIRYVSSQADTDLERAIAEARLAFRQAQSQEETDAADAALTQAVERFQAAIRTGLREKPRIIEDTDEAIVYDQPWGTWENLHYRAFGKKDTTEKIGFTVTFTGRSLSLYGQTAYNGPILEAYVDGVKGNGADFYSLNTIPGIFIWSVAGLEDGEHTVHFVYEDRFQPEALASDPSNFQAAIDYLVVNDPQAVTTEDPVIHASELTMNPREAELEVGETLGLIVTAAPAGAAVPQLTWSTSHEAVATVTDGVVTAVGEGTATITAAAEGSGLQAQCVITVTPNAQAEADKKAAKAVDDQIAALGEVTLDSEKAIAAARKAYEDLTEAQKTLVENLDALKAAEAKLQTLKDEAAQAEADKKAAKAVDDQITALGEVTLDSEEAIAAARKAYEELTEAQQALVENLDALKAAEAKLQTLKDEAARALEAARAAALAELEKIDCTGRHEKQMEAVRDRAAEAIRQADSVELVEALLEDAVELLARTALCPSEDFKDVKADGWYHDAVDYAIEQGLMKGVSKDKFSIDGTLTRGQLVTILYRAEGSPTVEGMKNPFADIVRAPQNWYADAVIWAYHNGIVKGVTDVKFAPMNKITREQLVSILYRYDGSHPVKGSLKDFADADKVSAYAREAMIWGVENGIVSGIPTGGQVLLKPQGNATRAQAAAIMMRFLENQVQ